MRRPGTPVFLERETYRRRRLMDAARFLPFLGAFAFLVPLLWAGEARTAAGLAYLFAAWAVLIGLSFVISRRLPLEDPRLEAQDAGEDPEDV